MGLEVRRYSDDLRDDWRDVVASARNALFLHERKFIEYHGDRFRDFSLVVYDDGRPIAVFPSAHTDGTWELTSHPGLTFGGLIVQRDVRTSTAICAVDAVLAAYGAAGIGNLLVKLLPTQFESYPSAEVEYQLWRRGFREVRKDLSSIIPLSDRMPLNGSRMESVRKAARAGLRLVSPGVAEFHGVLADVLMDEHGVVPVHSSAELGTLCRLYPDDILLLAAAAPDGILAVAAVFKYRHVWHTQYLANTKEGRRVGALDFIIDSVIRSATEAGARYVSFGVSTASQGQQLNEGLLWQKESFGARSMVHVFVGGSCG